MHTNTSTFPQGTRLQVLPCSLTLFSLQSTVTHKRDLIRLQKLFFFYFPHPPVSSSSTPEDSAPGYCFWQTGDSPPGPKTICSKPNTHTHAYAHARTHTHTHGNNKQTPLFSSKYSSVRGYFWLKYYFKVLLWLKILVLKRVHILPVFMVHLKTTK